MNIIDAIRTLRKERDLSFEDARAEAITFFLRNSLPIPEGLQPKTKAEVATTGGKNGD